MTEPNGKTSPILTVATISIAVVISLAAALLTHIDNQMSQIVQNQNEIMRNLVVLAIKCGVRAEDLHEGEGK